MRLRERTRRRPEELILDESLQPQHPMALWVVCVHENADLGTENKTKGRKRTQNLCPGNSHISDLQFTRLDQQSDDNPSTGLEQVLEATRLSPAQRMQQPQPFLQHQLPSTQPSLRLLSRLQHAATPRWRQQRHEAPSVPAPAWPPPTCPCCRAAPAPQQGILLC